MELIKCSDRLPELGESVLAIGKDGLIAVVHRYYYETTGNYYALLSSGCGCCDTGLVDVTDWMPLPASPKD